MQNNVLSYRQPEKGECQVRVTLINSANEKKDVTLVYSVTDAFDTEKILYEKQIEIDGETKGTDVYDAFVDKNEKINVYIR